MKQIWQEAKETVRDTVEYTVDSVDDLASQVDPGVTLEEETNVNAGSDVSFDEASGEAQADAGFNSQSNSSVETEQGNEGTLNIGGEAGADVNLSLNFGD